MKHLLLFLATSLVSAVTYAQCGRSEKFATFGIDFGINRSNLSFVSAQNNGDMITNGMGYRVGVISNFQFTRRLSLAPKAEVSFNTGQVSNDSETFSVSPNNLELLGHLKYKLRRGSFSPYIIAGPNARIPFGVERENILPIKDDIAIDLGVGLDIPIFRKRIAPELRYSFGLTNINRDATMSDVKYHNIALVLTLSGRR